MEDFLVKRASGYDGKEDWYMYIGFKVTRSTDHSLDNCYGLALVKPDEETEYWFSYSFHHSVDWTQVSGMVLKSTKRYGLSLEQVKKFANDILYNIKEFITKMN